MSTDSIDKLNIMTTSSKSKLLRKNSNYKKRNDNPKTMTRKPVSAKHTEPSTSQMYMRRERLGENLADALTFPSE